MMIGQGVYQSLALRRTQRCTAETHRGCATGDAHRHGQSIGGGSDAVSIGQRHVRAIEAQNLAGAITDIGDGKAQAADAVQGLHGRSSHRVK